MTELEIALRMDPDLIVRSFGSRAALGKSLFKAGAVEQIHCKDRKATAEVQGSARKPYKVHLSLAQTAGKLQRLSSECSCPYFSGCKHAAALAFALREARVQAPAPIETADATPTERPQPPVQPTQPQAAAKPSQPAQAAAPAVPQRPSPPRISAMWESWLRAAPVLLAEADPPERARDPRPVRFVVSMDQYQRLLLQPYRGKLGKQGAETGMRAFKIDHRVIERTVDDEPAVRNLLLALSPLHIEPNGQGGTGHLLTPDTDRALQAAVMAGRVRALSVDGAVLSWGESHPVQMDWRFDVYGRQHLMPRLPERWLLLDWRLYLDPDQARIGPIHAPGWSHAALQHLRQMPPLVPEEVAPLESSFAQLPATLRPPKPRSVPMDVVDSRPIGVWRVALLRASLYLPTGHVPGVELLPYVRYGNTQLLTDSPEDPAREFVDGRLHLHRRDRTFEARITAPLKSLGLRELATYDQRGMYRRWVMEKLLPLRPSLETWHQQLQQAAQRAGVSIEYDPGFPFRPAVVLEAVELEVLDPEAGTDWFRVRLGVEIEGQKVDLAPLLLAALTQPSAWTAEHLIVHAPDGTEWRLPRARITPWLELLLELDQRPEGLGVPRERVHALEPPADVRLQEGPAAVALRKQLANYTGPATVTPPASFKAELRPYQQQGVNWLQGLRELRFGGVLADDMGLGKTIQVLAHLCIEHAAGRLDRPALVVAPTSVLPNWASELRRFAPHLRAQVQHGGIRLRTADELADFDVVATSYALLQRDREILEAIDWSVLVFDEAQFLKNAGTKSYAAAAALRARQRLCLTGTPVENHLGELKAQFDLAFPGLLGTLKSFTKDFRTPIEREGDPHARARLRKRIAPFLLRRRKQEVATELPPRSTLVERIELTGAQRDLYELLRLQMEERVREALAQRGLAQSRITVLDALLKLRQVCCDPRLLSLEAARPVQESAKLERLLELLPVLIEDGRAILLFSQFTSMLDLIQERLHSLKLNWVRLDGSTLDRATPVQRFQNGEVPLFLISLKAGGVGLNLTRADTVILYDPWWNPAVEQQAIDRAHRIGQDKPVFVYELNCVDTVEDRMQELKAGKRAVADAVLEEGESALTRLTGEELLALFA